MAYKIPMNLGKNALNVLGTSQYMDLLFKLFLSLPKILVTRNLVSVDKRMSKKLKINYKGYKFVIDCSYTDNVIIENSYTFGIVREIYIRDCYFKFHEINLSELKNVIDLGSNRGAFSLLAANFADKVVSVEVQTKYNDVLAHNMRINGFNNYSVENVFVGEGGCFAVLKDRVKTLEEIMNNNGLQSIDFLKIDIEGSEFKLFSELNCLKKIRYISMEVHREYGNP